MDVTIPTAGTVDALRSTREMTAWRAVGLQILPGIPMTVTYLGLSAYFVGRGVPNAFALFVAILFVEVPISWFIMIREVRAEGSNLSYRSLFPFGRSLRRSVLFGIGIPAAIASVAIMFSLQGLIAEPIREALFSWMPTWAIYAMTPEMMAVMSSGMKTALAVLVLVSGVIVGATTQELYARGFLLPRIAHIGPWSTVISAVSFAVMHFTSPWAWPVFATTALVWSVLGYRFRSTALPLVGHVGMLLIMWLGMLFTLIA